jgi:hypothetical protein
MNRKEVQAFIPIGFYRVITPALAHALSVAFLVIIELMMAVRLLADKKPE